MPITKNNIDTLKSHLLKNFDFKQKWFWYVVLFFLIFKICLIPFFPIANDEAYYWDWSRSLQLSYVDAPPFVAWLAYIGGLFFNNEIGARLIVPFVFLVSTLFLVGTTKNLKIINNEKMLSSHVLSVLILSQLPPVFLLEGFLLLPDSGLLLGCAGSLFFLTNAYVNSCKNNSPLNLKNALGFGIFLGIAALSKYHALPIAVGLFFASICIRYPTHILKDLPFWIVTILVSIFVSSPVFIWNFNHNFASFSFQFQHGFSEFSIQLYPFARYLLGSALYIYPWFFILFLIFSFYFFKKKYFYRRIEFVFYFPFLILFFLILFSALGKQALPHWAMPGFFLLIPAVASKLELIQINKPIKFKNWILTSLLISLIVPALLAVPYVQSFIIRGFIHFKGNADDLAQIFIWKPLQNDLKNELSIKINSTNFSKILPPQDCQKTYSLASLRWMWTSQIAFHFKNQPRVYNFDLSNLSYYTWRDPLEQLALCKIIVLGSIHHFRQNELEQIMNIEDIEEFSIFPYNDTKMVLIKGTMKNKEVLTKVYNQIINTIKY